MKVFALLFSFLAVATAFAPTQVSRASTELKAANAGKESFWDTIFNMDLFEPVKEQNDYGARNKKGLTVAKVGSGSYVPDGLSLSEYQKVRDSDTRAKEANYSKNVKKAFKYTDFTDFYTKRGTDTSEAWFKSGGRGHTFAKTKYDFDTNKFGKKYDGSS